MTAFLKRATREPLLQFLVLGALLFVVYGLVSNGSEGKEGRVDLSQSQVASLWSSFVESRHRAPTLAEWNQVVRERVRQEVYYREALSLGFDKDDLIIRRRLQQKMQFYVEDSAGATEPTESELEAYLREHAAAYRTEERFTFRQVFLDPSKHRANLEHDAALFRDELARGGGGKDLARVGDPIMLDCRYESISFGDVENRFGDAFAAALARIPTGQWRGPLKSAYGTHLVFVSARIAGSAPPLAEVRAAVRRDWMNAHQVAEQDAFYRNLLRRYTVTVDLPPTGTNGLVSQR